MEISLTALQDQNMLLTPHMRQSMEMLHMSSLDLHEYVKRQASENPFIELRGGKEYKGRAGDWWLNADHAGEDTLEAVLLEQLAYLKLDRMAGALCRWIIGNLDEKGYLTYTKDEISTMQNVSVRQVSRAIDIIQSLEPHGVGASSLKECLLLQLRQMTGADPLAISLIQHDLPNIAEGRLQQLAVKYGTELPTVQSAIRQIRALNPKPGALYGRERPQYAIPDLKLKHIEGRFDVVLANTPLPEITLQASYLQLLDQPASKDVRRFLKQNWQAAKGLMDNIERRKATLLRTARLMVERQAEFCAKGAAHIQPMTMKQIADALQVHESTVSRTVNEKLIQTPWGMFELKRFFTSSIRQADGTSVSAAYMKERIREAIMGENSSIPLSDQQLTALLGGEGLLISRRTVAKYREQLNIPAAGKRKL